MPIYEHEPAALTLARLLIAQGEGEEALRLLDGYRTSARMQGRGGSEIELLVLSALAYDAQGESEQAVQTLQQALVLAEPAGYVRLFVDEGIPLARLLHLAWSRWKGKREAEFVNKLLVVLEAAPPGQTPLSAAHQHTRTLDPPIKPLSGRERKVLRLLAAGLSNPEIAAELVVSLSTVKTQVSSLYRKLNVTSRAGAIAAARSWKLL